MSWRSVAVYCAVGWALAAPRVFAKGPGSTGDDRLDAARRFVEKSGRYMHHGKLRRGMEGYGLTVLEGMKIVRFQAKVVSVVTKWGPHQDVILARLSGQNIEHTGIIAGMSGSPVFFRDPADGKDKIVGAVAYGWSGQKDPLCGIQPITQMLAVGELYKKVGKPGGKPAGKSAPPAPAAGRAEGAAVHPQELSAFLRTVLDPRKLDFAVECLPKRATPAARRASASAAPTLVPLATPLMVSGARAETLAELGRRLEPLGIVPVASGGVNPQLGKAAREARLQAGSAIAVPLVTGDADFSAVGTVTDVVGDRVLAFGHSFYGEGDLALPLGPAYVHTVVAGLFRSFKLTAGLGVAGTLERDEQVGVGGRIGPKPPMIPMTVTVEHRRPPRKETFRYQLANHRSMTPMFARSVLADAARAWHDLPEHHTVRYRVSMDYGKLGKYRAENVATGDDVFPAISDLTRPMVTMLSNPYGPRIAPRRIDAHITIEPGDRSAAMLDFKLEGRIYRPGETVAGAVTIRLFRSDRKRLDVRFKLPDDLPDGNYSLTVCDYARDVSFRQKEMPHRFAPRTTRRLFEAIQYVVRPRADNLYLRLPLPDGGGLALAQRELPDLPSSRAQILGQAELLDTRTFRKALVRTMKTDYLVTGSAKADFTVRRRPAQTILRK